MTASTCLVTGGCGFIGGHVVDLLVKRGIRVRVLDNQCGQARHPDVEYVHGSILDEGTLSRAMRGADRVYHLAANPNLWVPDKREFDRVNHRGTRMVLRQAEREGVQRMVYTSTESILKSYRRPASQEHLDDTAASDVDDMPGPYCRSKYLAEQAAREAAEGGLPVVIVNPTLPVGPGDCKLTPPTRMLQMFLNGEARAYLDCEVNMIDVRDVAVGHILAAEKGRIGERYILGNENVRLSAVLRMLEELTGLAMPRFRVPYAVAFATGVVSEFIADHITHRPPIAPLTGVCLARVPDMFDSSKAVRELGLPRTPLRTSLAHAVAWLDEHGKLKRKPPVSLSTPVAERSTVGIGR